MNHASLFTGIGGFDYAAEKAGINNIFSVEIDDFCNKRLEKNFPHVKKYRDIRRFDGTPYRGTIDILSGGFPCQPFSVAGKQEGTNDERHLFPEMLRVVSEIKPPWVIAENVYGLLNIQDGLVFEQVCSELENLNYEVQTFCIPALSVNAPHRRDRLWIIANANSQWELQPKGIESNVGERVSDYNTIAPDSNSAGLQGQFFKDNRKGAQSDDKRTMRCGGGWRENWFEVATKFCRMDAGVSDRIHRLKALGNSIVPQIAEIIFRIILIMEEK